MTELTSLLGDEEERAKQLSKTKNKYEAVIADLEQRLAKEQEVHTSDRRSVYIETRNAWQSSACSPPGAKSPAKLRFCWTNVYQILGRLFDRVDLIKPVSNVRPSVCPSVRAYVRAYLRPFTKSFFDFNEIWHVGRGR